MTRRGFVVSPHFSGSYTPPHTLHYGGVVSSNGGDYIIDAVCWAMLVSEQGRLYQVEEEIVCFIPMLTDPVFM